MFVYTYLCVCVCVGFFCVYAHVSMSAHKKVSPSLYFILFFGWEGGKYILSAPAVVQEHSQTLSLASSASVYETRHLVYLFLSTC